MTESYYTPENLEQLSTLAEAAPDGMRTFLAFDKQALRSRTKVIPRKYTELMALAVALTTQCPHCIEEHTLTAKAEGASPQEIAETVTTAAALRAGAAVTHGGMAMRIYTRGPLPQA